MTNSTELEDDHADGILEIGSYEAPRPPEPKEFLPWHRPRKQYVRQFQWCREIANLVSSHPPTDGTLKYLGLPGVDLLDLRHFHEEVCQSKSIRLRFLGFISSVRPASPAHSELNISLDEVRRLPQVDPMSDVLGDNFASVANINSLAARRTRSLGPYDVINLDLCDGFGAQAPGSIDNNYYNAVRNLLALQARNPHPWLLLLTTRADKSNINSDVLAKLLEKYSSNLSDCQSFREASRDHFNIATADSLTAAVQSPKSLAAVFLTGVCKWLVGMALNYQPPNSVELLSAIGYRVDKRAVHEDLISLAFKFSPTFYPPGDPLGLASLTTPSLDEGTMATRALKRVARRIDADRKLSEDSTLNQRMTDATARLLGLARYDVGAYREWLQTV